MTPHRACAVLVGLVGVLILAPVGAAAQGRPPGVGPSGVKLKLNQSTVAFPMPGIAEFDGGWVDASPIVVTVEPRANQGPWELRLRGETPDLGGYGKPLSDILWRPAGSTRWLPLSSTDPMVAQGVGGQAVTIHFRLRLDYAADLPASYATDLLFYAEVL